MDWEPAAAFRATEHFGDSSDDGEQPEPDGTSSSERDAEDVDWKRMSAVFEQLDGITDDPVLLAAGFCSHLQKKMGHTNLESRDKVSRIQYEGYVKFCELTEDGKFQPSSPSVIDLTSDDDTRVDRNLPSTSSVHPTTPVSKNDEMHADKKSVSEKRASSLDYPKMPKITKDIVSARKKSTSDIILYHGFDYGRHWWGQTIDRVFLYIDLSDLVGTNPNLQIAVSKNNINVKLKRSNSTRVLISNTFYGPVKDIDWKINSDFHLQLQIQKDDAVYWRKCLTTELEFVNTHAIEEYHLCTDECRSTDIFAGDNNMRENHMDDLVEYLGKEYGFDESPYGSSLSSKDLYAEEELLTGNLESFPMDLNSAADPDGSSNISPEVDREKLPNIESSFTECVYPFN